MTDATDYYRDAVISHAFLGDDMPSAHSSCYVALHDGNPTTSGEENELTASSYDRQEVSNPSGWNELGNGHVENGDEIGFGIAEETWGEITHFSIWDGPSGTDNAIVQSELDEPKTIDQQDEIRFNAGALTAEIQ